MNHYFIKFVLYSVLMLGVMACSSGLDKKYNRSSREKDYQEIEKLLSSEDFKLLKEYIQTQETENEDISDDTYRVILNSAKIQEKIRIEQELYLAELEKQKAAEKVIIQQKMELLCGKEWKIENVEFVIETDDSVTVMELTDEAVKAFTGNGKRRKIYLSDGTYKEVFGREEMGKGTWEFTSPDVIRETRPAGSSSIRKNNMYVLTIETLDENQFRYIEKSNHSAYGPSTGSSKLVTMAAGN